MGGPALWICTETRLDLRVPLHELPGAQRLSLLRWLQLHDVDALTLVVGRPIEREPETGTLIWFAATHDGVVIRRTTRAVAAGRTWPLPFPAAWMNGGASGSGVASAPA